MRELKKHKIVVWNIRRYSVLKQIPF